MLGIVLILTIYYLLLLLLSIIIINMIIKNLWSETRDRDRSESNYLITYKYVCIYYIVNNKVTLLRNIIIII